MPKSKIPDKFTPRIIEAINWSSTDLPVKLVADKMSIKPGGVRSLIRNARAISGKHSICTLFRKAVEDGDITLTIKCNPNNPPYTT